jgi:hypothetical protein
MAVNQEYPVLNGIAPSWADIVVNIMPSGTPLIKMIDIQSVNTSRSVEVGYQRGASGGRKLNRTTGAGDEEASITVYMSGYNQIVANLSEVAPRRGNEYLISLVPFDIQLLWTPPGETSIKERLVEGCRIIGDTLNDTEGSDATVVELPLSVMRIVDVVNGRRIVMI